MWLAFYNPNHVGDVLMLTSGSAEQQKLTVETLEDVAVIRFEGDATVRGLNIFNVADWGIEDTGAVTLDEALVTKINSRLQQVGVDVAIEVDLAPRLVVGYVEQCEDHPDSDHLHVTKTRVSESEVLQIVCGAANIAQGQSVIVAKPGAVMPNGLIIWPGELRGVASYGMICSTRELEVTAIENEPGIWVLKEGFIPGTPLADVVAAY